MQSLKKCFHSGNNLCRNLGSRGENGSMFFMFGYPNASIVFHGPGIGSKHFSPDRQKCVRDNNFFESMFTSKNETSESPCAKKIMTRGTLWSLEER